MPDQHTPHIPAQETLEDWRWLARPDVTHLEKKIPGGPMQGAAAQAGVQPEPAVQISVILQAKSEHIHLSHIMYLLLREMDSMGKPYEVIVVDEGFYRNESETVQFLQKGHHISLYTRPAGLSGPLTTEEMQRATGEKVVVFDADMYCEPGVIGLMADALSASDIVLGDPFYEDASAPRRFARRAFRFLTSPLSLLMLGVPRAGLRAYRRTVLDKIQAQPVHHPGHSFDAQALYSARRLRLVVAHQRVPVPYRPLQARMYLSQLRVRMFSEIMALRQRLLMRFSFPFLFPPTHREYSAAGFTNVRDYLFRDDAESAKRRISKETVSLAIVTVLGACALLLLTSFIVGQSVDRVVIFSLSIFYLFLILLKLYTIIQTAIHPVETVSPAEIAALLPQDLPVVSILIPLYKEKEVIPQIFKRLGDLDYPADKLDIIFILESVDQETIDAFLANNPAPHFKALLAPNVWPKTKPKALNVAFQKSYGEFIVIYDADILPDTDQVKKAHVMFKKHPEVNYVHSRMNVYNGDYNWLTKMYDAEFSFFYDYFLPGLVTLNVPLPISGHSTYFRREVIEKVGGWDPYNVAEDCDIGIRLYRHGFKSGMMMDSFSWEQSTTTLDAWFHQRTRWVQGFMQTSIVHLRYPLLLKEELGSWRNFMWFLFLVPGNFVLNLLNVLHWFLFLSWVMFHWSYIQFLYPMLTQYISNACFYSANFLFMYFNLLGLYSRRHFKYVPSALFTCVYWIMLGAATFKAAVNFCKNPYKWDKTAHTVAPQNSNALATA